MTVPISSSKSRSSANSLASVRRVHFATSASFRVFGREDRVHIPQRRYMTRSRSRREKELSSCLSRRDKSSWGSSETQSPLPSVVSSAPLFSSGTDVGPSSMADSEDDYMSDVGGDRETSEDGSEDGFSEGSTEYDRDRDRYRDSPEPQSEPESDVDNDNEVNDEVTQHLLNTVSDIDANEHNSNVSSPTRDGITNTVFGPSHPQSNLPRPSAPEDRTDYVSLFAPLRQFLDFEGTTLESV